MSKLLEELCNDSRYSHAVFGCFEGMVHSVQDLKGNMPQINQYADTLEEYVESFDGEKSGKEFIAKVHGEEIAEGFKLKLIYNDRKGDKRGASHTDYTLLIPKSEVQRVLPEIKSDPSIMVDLFQNVFPNYDRSAGTLVINSQNPLYLKDFG